MKTARSPIRSFSTYTVLMAIQSWRWNFLRLQVSQQLSVRVVVKVRVAQNLRLQLWISTRAETNPDFIESESWPGGWNEYQVPTNTTGHLIRWWNLIGCWLLSKQKRTICDIISSLIDIKQWRLVISKTEKYHDSLAVVTWTGSTWFCWDQACCKDKMVDYWIRILAVG